jgi:hypothetical protein
VKSDILLSAFSKTTQLSELTKYFDAIQFQNLCWTGTPPQLQNFFIPIPSFETTIDTKPQQLGQ